MRFALSERDATNVAKNYAAPDSSSQTRPVMVPATAGIGPARALELVPRPWFAQRGHLNDQMIPHLPECFWAARDAIKGGNRV